MIFFIKWILIVILVVFGMSGASAATEEKYYIHGFIGFFLIMLAIGVAVNWEIS